MKRAVNEDTQWFYPLKELVKDRTHPASVFSPFCRLTKDTEVSSALAYIFINNSVQYVISNSCGYSCKRRLK